MSFNPYGVTLKLPTGDMILNAGSNMTILPQGNLITFAAQFPSKSNAPYQPPALADAAAPNNSVYFSIDAGKLAYKDASGTVNPLY